MKMKPTILYALFAGILGFGLLRGQSYLKYLMDEPSRCGTRAG